LEWKKGIASSFGNLGVYYRIKADYPRSLDYFLKALKIDEEIENKSGIATRLGNIGSLFWNQADYQEALEFYLKALRLNRELEDHRGIALNLSNIGSVYYSQASRWGQKGDTAQANRDYAKALDSYSESIKISEKKGYKQLEANTLGNIGIVFKDLGNYREALNNSLRALKLSEELGDRNSVAFQLGNLGSLYTEDPSLPSPDGEEKTGFALAAHYLHLALAVSDSIGAMDNVKNWYEQLSILYEKSTVELPVSAGSRLLSLEEMRRLSLYYYKRHIAIRDAIFNAENKKQLLIKEMNYTFAKKNAIADADKKRQQDILILESVVLFFVLVFAGLIFRSLRITRRQKATIEKQKQLVEKSDHEKELLLKEIHHRVKNNLQVISSLLSLQSHNITDAATLAVVSQARLRVRSMTLVHQKLYQGGNLSEVDFGQYLEELTSHINEMYHDGPAEISCTVTTEERNFNIDTAIPLGLILTELLSNSYKYAFKDRSEGKINISITKADDRFFLLYSDDGIGLPDNVQFEDSSTLGLELVSMLTKQLGGTVKAFNNKGAVFEVYFRPVPNSH